MSKKETAPVVVQVDIQELLARTKILLQATLHRIRTLDPFCGSILQSMDILYDTRVPTLGIAISKEMAEYRLIINPVFFTLALDDKQRLACLAHEIYHITAGHLARIPFQFGLDPKEKFRLNFAADGSINQYIKNLPDGCVDITKMSYVDDKGNTLPFPRLKALETYYKILPNEIGEGMGEGEGKGGKGQKQCQECGGTGKDEDGSPCKHCHGTGNEPGKYGQVIDDHGMWEDAAQLDEGEMLKATERLIEKASYGYSTMPEFAKDFLKYAAVRKRQLNYKALLNRALRRSLAGLGRKGTWKRPNRKYDNEARGTKSANTPKLHIFIDTSGSISVEEANNFLAVVKDLTRVTGNSMRVSFFHTNVYGTRVMKRSSVVKEGELQSGGTDLTEVLRTSIKLRPELTIILTDGYYGNVAFEGMLPRSVRMPTTCFVITKQGEENHPLKRLGSTIKMPSDKE